MEPAKDKKREVTYPNKLGKRQQPINLRGFLRFSLLMLVALALFYFLFIDLRVYLFFYELLSRLTSEPLVLYPLAFVIGLPIVSGLYYQTSCPFIEDSLSIGAMNKFIVRALEDQRSHNRVHAIIFLWLLLARFISCWLGAGLGLTFYLILWGGALFSLLTRVVTMRPLSRDDRKYREAKTSWARTRRNSSHWRSVKTTSPIFLAGELVLYILYCILH